MKIKDKIKLEISRNWKFPGQMRLLKYLKPSAQTSSSLKNGIIWLENEDLAIFTTSDSYIENAILTMGTYEAEIEKIISFSLNSGDIALDIGCNIGLQSLRMQKAVGDSGKVIAFEPLTYLQEKSRKNFKLNRCNSIQLLPYALSDKEGTMEITINENIYNQGTFSLLQPPSGTSKQIVEIKAGDELEEIKSLNHLNLIKIDVEGFEFNVLKGLTSTIARFRPRIIFEYDSNYWLRNDQKILECYKFLTGLNYSFYQISFVGCELIAEAEQIRDGNLLCIAEE